MTLAGDAYQHARCFLFADRERGFSVNPADTEMVTMNEPLAQSRCLLRHIRDYGTECYLCKINASQRSSDLQRAMLACSGIDVIPVIKAKCYVAVLLDFKNHDVLQGMDGASAH
jgi:hypothetical protein